MTRPLRSPVGDDSLVMLSPRPDPDVKTSRAGSSSCDFSTPSPQTSVKSFVKFVSGSYYEISISSIFTTRVTFRDRILPINLSPVLKLSWSQYWNPRRIEDSIPRTPWALPRDNYQHSERLREHQAAWAQIDQAFPESRSSSKRERSYSPLDSR